MPELAAVYFIGCLASLSLTGVFAWLSARRYRQTSSQNLSANLRRLNLYWSENRDRILEWSENAERLDQAASRKTIWITGAFMTLLSWPGLCFLLIIMISYRFLARSRTERQLFASALVKSADLSQDEVKKICAELSVLPSTPEPLS